MAWIKRHWVSVIGLFSFVEPALRFSKWLIGLLGDIDFVIARSKEPDWLGVLVQHLLDLPAWSSPVLVLVGLGLIYWDVRRNRVVKPSVRTTKPDERPSGHDVVQILDPHSQRVLIRELTEIGSYDDDPRPEAQIDVEAVVHVPLGSTLSSIFELAGWTTHFNATPQEHFTHRYREGIEVHGWNKSVTRAVYKSLVDAGLSEVREIIEETAVKPDNPKWKYIQRRIRIRIGHTRTYG